MGFSYDWVDAFAARAFCGNGCAVVYDAENLGIEERLALVRETSLSECAYLVGSDAADFGVRYYLADREIPMAGHPTIATVVSLIDRGHVDISTGGAKFTLEVGAGILPIEIVVNEGKPVITMTQMAPEFGQTFEPDAIAAIFGLSARDVVGRPQVVSTGTPFCITVLRDKLALERAILDIALLEEFQAGRAIDSAGLMEPFLVTLGGETDAGDTFSRLLLAPPSQPEDPFTGSATGCMAAYLWRHRLIETPHLVAEQGHWLGRPGQAHVEILGARNSISGIKVGGQGYVLMRGELFL